MALTPHPPLMGDEDPLDAIDAEDGRGAHDPYDDGRYTADPYDEAREPYEPSPYDGTYSED